MSDGANPHREFPRHAVAAGVKLLARSGDIVHGQTRNVSVGGLCVELARDLELGADTEVFLALVFSDARWSEPLGLPARVVWCTPIGDGHQLGLQFRQLCRRQRTYLDMFLRYLAGPPDGDDPADPARPGVSDRFSR